MQRVSLKVFSGTLFAQAGIAAFFAFLRTGGPTDHTMGLQLALAAGAAGVGLYLRSEGSLSREVVLGFEGLAVLAGVYGLINHSYLPGTIIAISVLARCANLPRHASAAPANGPHPYGVAPFPQGPHPNEQYPPAAYQPAPQYPPAAYQPAPQYQQPAHQQPTNAPIPQQPAAPSVDYWGTPPPQPQPAAPTASHAAQPGDPRYPDAAFRPPSG